MAEVPIIDQYSVRISQILNDLWLLRYPRLRKVNFDNGFEFKRNFIPFIKYLSAKLECNNIKNPQANTILEIINQVFGSMLKAKDLTIVTFEAVAPWSNVLASIAYVVQCSYHSTLQATPEKLVFGWNMLLDINLQPSYKDIWLRKQKLTNYNNKRENEKQVQYDYKVGHYAYIIRDGKYRKWEGYKLGKFRITQIHTNGFFRTQRVIVNEQINTRRLTPHFWDPPT